MHKGHIRVLAGHINAEAGSHRYHWELAERLSKRGFEVSVLCYSCPPKSQDSYVKYIPLERVDYSTRAFWWQFGPLLVEKHLASELGTRKMLKPDCVIGGEHLLLRPHYRRFPRTPWIYLPHSLITDHEIAAYRLPFVAHHVARLVYRRSQVWALRHANAVVRFTRKACEALQTHFRLRDTRFVVNRVGVEVPAAKQAIAGTDVRILSVGRLLQSKGLDIAIEALAKNKQSAWHFDIVGDGEAVPGLKRQVAESGLEDRITFHGFQADPAPWYRNADLFLFPSRSESLGLVLLEAMGAGLACLAIMPDGGEFKNVNDELIRHAENGFLADSPGDFTRQLADLLQNPSKLAAVGEAARDFVIREHSWDRHLDRYEELFHQLVKA